MSADYLRKCQRLNKSTYQNNANIMRVNAKCKYIWVVFLKIVLRHFKRFFSVEVYKLSTLKAKCVKTALESFWTHLAILTALMFIRLSAFLNITTIKKFPYFVECKDIVFFKMCTINKSSSNFIYN